MCLGPGWGLVEGVLPVSLQPRRFPRTQCVRQAGGRGASHEVGRLVEAAGTRQPLYRVRAWALGATVSGSPELGLRAVYSMYSFWLETLSVF